MYILDHSVNLFSNPSLFYESILLENIVRTSISYTDWQVDNGIYMPALRFARLKVSTIGVRIMLVNNFGSITNAAYYERTDSYILNRKLNNVSICNSIRAKLY